MKPIWEELSGIRALFVPTGFFISQKSDDGVKRLACEYGIEDDDYTVNYPANRGGFYILPKLHCRYECNCGINVNEFYCPHCKAKTILYQNIKDSEKHSM